MKTDEQEYDWKVPGIGELTIFIDWQDPTSPICFLDTDGDWAPTRFRARDALGSPRRALRLVLNYLADQSMVWK